MINIIAVDDRATSETITLTYILLIYSQRNIVESEPDGLKHSFWVKNPQISHALVLAVFPIA